ncbi:HlyD family secretion protein [Sporolactobacillus sp. THM7-7]|nr:HlyD family secretion protein [Sporolactobacillus sp. THM7-7]
MNNFVRLLIINIIVIIVLIGGGAVGYYYYDQTTNYVKTDNANINGEAISIASPAAGKLVSWDVRSGKTFHQNQTIGKVEGAGADGKPIQTSIKMPEHATIAQNSGVSNTFVGAGTQLAQAFDLGAVYVTANIDETDLDRVKTGQKVDIYVDAFPHTAFSGKVEQIGNATAGTFSLLPNSNSNGNYTKVTQVIPVKISLDSFKGDKLLPGMSVTVKIHV